MWSKVFRILLLFIAVGFASEKDVFLDLNLQKALDVGNIQGKPILVKFDTVWCHFCRKMDQETFSDSDVRMVLADFVTIKVNVDTPAGQKLA